MENRTFDEVQGVLSALELVHEELRASVTKAAGRDPETGASVGTLAFILGEMLDAIVEHATTTGVLELALTYKDMVVLCRTKHSGKLATAESLQSLFSAKFSGGGTSIGVPLALGGNYSVTVEVTGTRSGTRGRPKKGGAPAMRGLKLALLRDGKPVQVTSLPASPAAHPFYRRIEELRSGATPRELDGVLAWVEGQLRDNQYSLPRRRLAQARAALARLSTAALVLLAILFAGTTAVASYVAWRVFFRPRTVVDPARQGQPIDHSNLGPAVETIPVDEPRFSGFIERYATDPGGSTYYFTATRIDRKNPDSNIRYLWMFNCDGFGNRAITDVPRLTVAGVPEETCHDSFRMRLFLDEVAPNPVQIQVQDGKQIVLRDPVTQEPVSTPAPAVDVELNTSQGPRITSLALMPSATPGAPPALQSTDGEFPIGPGGMSITFPPGDHAPTIGLTRYSWDENAVVGLLTAVPAADVVNALVMVDFGDRSDLTPSGRMPASAFPGLPREFAREDIALFMAPHQFPGPGLYLVRAWAVGPWGWKLLVQVDVTF